MATSPTIVSTAVPTGSSFAALPTATVPTSSTTDANTVIYTREVHKNGWLKSIPTRERRTTPFVKVPKPEKMWVVFCIHDDVNPFLEYYDSRRSAFSHQPGKSIPLASCVHVSPNIVVNNELEPDFVFSIALESELIKLGAASREQMTEWIDTLKNKLIEIGVLQPRCNLYTKAPELRVLLASNRDPTSPLPPPPLAPRFSSSTFPRSSSEPSSPTFVLSLAASSQSNTTHVSPVSTVPSISNSRPQLTLPPRSSLPRSQINSSHPPSPMSPNSTLLWQEQQQQFIAASSSLQTAQSGFRPVVNIGQPVTLLSNNSNNHFDFEASALVLPSTVTTTANSDVSPNLQNNNNINFSGNPSNVIERIDSTIVNSNENANNYEPIFLANTMDRTILCGIRNPSYFSPRPPSMACTSSSSPSSSSRISNVRQRASSEERPPGMALLESSNLNERSFNESEETVSAVNGPLLTLREKQIFLLCREINSPGGVRLLLPRKDCINTIAFVEFLGAVWIAGWKQREHPFLYHSFHIGDRVLKVGGRDVRSVQEVHKSIKTESSFKLEFIIARVPYGQVYALKRETDGQDLGLIREGNTAEIAEVVAGGLAFCSGLPTKASSCSNSGQCNWVMTEINDRPLNLFFKDREVQDRLNAVGREISILVQPGDFVYSLKKQLKSLRSYKDYIVQ